VRKRFQTFVNSLTCLKLSAKIIALVTLAWLVTQGEDIIGTRRIKVMINLQMSFLTKQGITGDDHLGFDRYQDLSRVIHVVMTLCDTEVS
jgi:hypothetical protein